MIFKVVRTFDVDMVELKMSKMEYLVCLGFSYIDAFWENGINPFTHHFHFIFSNEITLIS